MTDNNSLDILVQRCGVGINKNIRESYFNCGHWRQRPS